MNPRYTLLVALALAGAVATHCPVRAADSGQARNRVVRTLAVFADPHERGIDSGAGVLVQIGGEVDYERTRRWGLGSTEFILEVGHVRFDQTETISLDGVAYSVEGKLGVTPVLAGWRWALPLSREGKLSAAFGLTAGGSWAQLSVDVEEPDGSLAGKWSRGKGLWTIGADLGLAYRASDTIELLAGYRYLVLMSSNWNVDGASVPVGTIKADVLYAGMGWRF